MSFLVRLVTILGCIVIPHTLPAAEDEGVGPFGLVLGQSSPSVLADRFPSASHRGISTWTRGALYQVPGSELPLQGAKHAVFVFDLDEQLDAAFITIEKRRFHEVMRLLDGQYRRLSASVPHVGNRHVKWEADDIVIELDAPHLSFEMELQYQTKQFLEQFERGQAEQREQQRQREAEQL